jgi:hypothetical protein
LIPLIQLDRGGKPRAGEVIVTLRCTIHVKVILRRAILGKAKWRGFARVSGITPPRALGAILTALGITMSAASEQGDN